jgi:hypothetical protein
VSQQLTDVYIARAQRGELHSRGIPLDLLLVEVDSPDGLIAVTPVDSLRPNQLLVVSFRKPWTRETSWSGRHSRGQRERVESRVRHSTTEFERQLVATLPLLGAERLMVVAEPHQLDRIGVGMRRLGVPVYHPRALDNVPLPYDDRSAEGWTRGPKISAAYETAMYHALTLGMAQ